MNEDILEIEQEVYEIIVEQSGADGVAGNNGLSAYQIALNNGFVGTQVEWLESLKGADGIGIKGEDGDSAYQVALSNGFLGTQSQWLESLKGVKGDDGTAATVAVGTTTTLPAGSTATATNVGTNQNAIINFGIPKGADGTSVDPAVIANIQSIINRSDMRTSEFKTHRYSTSTGLNFAYAAMTSFGFYSVNQSKLDYSNFPMSYVANKEYYYYPSKTSFKDTDNPIGTAAGGVKLTAGANIYAGLDLLMTVGQRTNNDSQLSMFCGIVDSYNSFQSPNYVFTTLFDNCYVGFGYYQTDTNIKFVVKNNVAIAPFSLDLSLFTGNFTANDILARQKEVPFVFGMKTNTLKNGLTLYFVNLATNHFGTYNLLFSQVSSMFDIKIKFFSPIFTYQHKNGATTSDVLDFFNTELWSN